MVVALHQQSRRDVHLAHVHLGNDDDDDDDDDDNDLGDDADETLTGSAISLSGS